MRPTSLYDVLGVSRAATSEEIKAAHRKLALECHPDRFPNDSVRAERFRSVQAAYDVLSNPDLRRKYDAGRVAELPEAARLVIERMGAGLVDGIAAAAKLKATQAAKRLGAKGERAAGVATQAVDLGAELAREALALWLKKT